MLLLTTYQIFNFKYLQFLNIIFNYFKDIARLTKYILGRFEIAI